MEFDVNGCNADVIFVGVPEPPNARFWEYINDSWVKVTLRYNQTLHHVRYQDTEEGWSRRSIQWEHEGNKVVCYITSQAKDCDGRLDRYSDYECLLSELHNRRHSYAAGAYADNCFPKRVSVFERDSINFRKNLMLPCWVEIGYSQRDYSA